MLRFRILLRDDLKVLLVVVFLINISIPNASLKHSSSAAFNYIREKFQEADHTKQLDQTYTDPGKSTIIPFAGCNTDAYPPERSYIPKYIIDLNAPPKRRWSKLIEDKRDELKQMSCYIDGLLTKLFGQKVFTFINESLPLLAKTLPEPYYEELQGIAEASGVSVMEATLFNIFYEVFTVCTSIVTQDTKGRIKHGRNLDFGLFLGWDIHNDTWSVTELLRPLVVHLEFKKSEETIFEAVSFAGFVGVITAVKKGKFSFSLDERFSWNGGYVGLLEWIIFNDHQQKWVSFLAREVMENAETFDEAKLLLSRPRLLAPVYYILGGTKPGEGVIITRYRSSFNILELGTAQVPNQGSWYLVETNYDHWVSPPFYDDRRTPAIQCLKKGGRDNASLELIYDVLSTRPVLNKLTTFTSLMSAEDCLLETWLRDCPSPCWPW